VDEYISLRPAKAQVHHGFEGRRLTLCWLLAEVFGTVYCECRNDRDAKTNIIAPPELLGNLFKRGPRAIKRD
jgi:hypothetical protein